MTIDELEARDAAERVRLRRKSIQDVANAIEIRRAARGRTDCLERHLAQLQAA